jgi:hypothetical protein
MDTWIDAVLGSVTSQRIPQVPAMARRVHRTILRTFADTGTPPTQDQVGDDHSLELLAAHDIIGLDDTGEIAYAYPFSTRSTTHRVRLAGGARPYAMCAIDALGIPAMLDTDAVITSRDAHTGEPITSPARPPTGSQVKPWCSSAPAPNAAPPPPPNPAAATSASSPTTATPSHGSPSTPPSTASCSTKTWPLALACAASASCSRPSNVAPLEPGSGVGVLAGITATGHDDQPVEVGAPAHAVVLSLGLVGQVVVA